MNNIENLHSKEAIDKLKSLVRNIEICLFCTNLKTDDGAMCRPMSAIKVCDQGNIWFFSEKNSDKNNAIDADHKVQLFFSHPEKHSYLVVNGEASIILEPAKIEELWMPSFKIWFKEGIQDPSISIIKVVPTTAYYWDADVSRMVNVLEMEASVVSGKDLLQGKEGSIAF